MEHIAGCAGPGSPDPTGYSGECLMGKECPCWCHEQPTACCTSEKLAAVIEMFKLPTTVLAMAA